MAARLPCDFLPRGMCLVGHVNLSAATCIQMCPMIPCVPNKPHNSVRSVDCVILSLTVFRFFFPFFKIFLFPLCVAHCNRDDFALLFCKFLILVEWISMTRMEKITVRAP